MRQNMATPCFGAEAAGDLLLHFDHAQIALRLIIVKWNGKIEQEAQHRPLALQRVDPADCEQGFVWLALVFASTVQTSWGRGRGIGLVAFGEDLIIATTASVPAPAHPVRAGPRLWLAPPRLSCPAAGLSSCVPRLA